VESNEGPWFAGQSMLHPVIGRNVTNCRMLRRQACSKENAVELLTQRAMAFGG
jgi:hypothetical protein